MDTDRYQEPLVSRYTSDEMQRLFSEQVKFSTWRKCWLALAEAQYELGLTDLITPAMLDEMRGNVDNIDFAVARDKEAQIRHDVMAHVYEFGLKCPAAAPIIHLGATSQFVVCNTDQIIQRQALHLIKNDLLNTIERLATFAHTHRDLATLGYTHYQPAQPTTIGKRMCLYIYDLLIDLTSIDDFLNRQAARGAKGTVGTQATFLELFDNDHGKVRELDKLVAHKLGFSRVLPVTGQTYSRKLDMKLLEILAGIGATAHKFGVDLRLSANLKILEEPFAANQTGSSAMAYKRNPMRSERMTGLARKLMGLPANAAATYANQWLERSLDDSAIRRMDIPQAFLLTDAILRLYINISSGMVVYDKQIERLLNLELPFMATEKILMEAVRRGKSRQEMHEIIKHHAVAAGVKLKQEAKDNDLLKRLGDDENIPFTYDELCDMTTDYRAFTGRASQQTVEFLNEHVYPVLHNNKNTMVRITSDVTV
jgi:adenylosuccinate lyase